MGIRAKAFTLLELAATVAILGIVVSLGAVGYSALFSSSADALGPSALGVVRNAVQAQAATNGFAIPASSLAQQSTLRGIPITTTGPSLAPDSPASTPEDLLVAITFPPGVDPAVAGSTSAAAALAVRTSENTCSALIYRTTVVGNQLPSVTSSWSGTEPCRVCPQTIDTVLADPNPLPAYDQDWSVCTSP